MQSALADTTVFDAPGKRWFWNREVRLFLIHYGIWLAISLLSAWLELYYLSPDKLKETDKLLGSASF